MNGHFFTESLFLVIFYRLLKNYARFFLREDINFLCIECRRTKLEKVLIVDDSEMNRDLLADMLEDEYTVSQAESGEEALSILEKKHDEYSCVLLDLNMGKVSGYDVLIHMEEKDWLSDLPVIIISAEESMDRIKKAYSLGAIDFISRPFDMEIVQRRVGTTIAVYSNQRRLSQKVADQLYENERSNTMLLSMLGHIVEFRNKESGAHIESVGVLTQIFLEHLVQKTEQYALSDSDIKTIARASVLHDAGKISVPYTILNKPGRLTPEEFDIMKKHTLAGSEMIEACTQFKDEPIVKTSYAICRWHHERYDGKGYPDGLKGEDIPIAAQVVALADVYDALTSERCYKKAFTHEEAVRMILNGECGCFNPLLIDILRDMAPVLPDLLKQGMAQREQLIKRSA